jgi:hypothetical protein
MSVIVRVRTPKKYKLTSEEVELCSLTEEQKDREALRSAVNKQIEDAIDKANQWTQARKKHFVTSSRNYPIVKHS